MVEGQKKGNKIQSKESTATGIKLLAQNFEIDNNLSTFDNVFLEIFIFLRLWFTQGKLMWN